MPIVEDPEHSGVLHVGLAAATCPGFELEAWVDLDVDYGGAPGSACVHCGEPIENDGDQWVFGPIDTWVSENGAMLHADANPYCAWSPNGAHSPP